MKMFNGCLLWDWKTYFKLSSLNANALLLMDVAEWKEWDTF